MEIGTKFEATDKLGKTYTYQLNKVDPANKSREYILTNLTLNCITEVELEWFNQRKIVIKEN